MIAAKTAPASTDKRSANAAGNGASAGEARLMSTQAELKQFADDFAVCQANSRTAVSYLEFAEEAARAQTGMRRTWQAALECGQALKRMHDTKSYLDTFGSWAALCRGLSMSRSNSYRLKALADAPAPAAVADPGPDEPSTVADPDVDVDVDQEDHGELPHSGLRDTLAAMSGKLDDDDAAPHTPRDAVWVEKQTVSLARYFAGKACADAARPHLEALVEIAKRAG